VELSGGPLGRAGEIGLPGLERHAELAHRRALEPAGQSTGHPGVDRVALAGRRIGMASGFALSAQTAGGRMMWVAIAATKNPALRMSTPRVGLRRAGVAMDLGSVARGGLWDLYN
jgi:hypothetical protein